MIRAFYSGSLGLKAQQNAVDITANNIANSETNGFKQKTEKFGDLLYSSMVGLGVNSTNTTRLVVGNGAAISQVQNDMTQGQSDATGIATDYCIMGDGFFAAKDASGNTSYTRDGSFKTTTENGTAFLEDSQGRKVLDKNQNPIKMNNGAVSTQPGVFAFSNSSELKSAGENNYVQTALSGTPAATAVLVESGSLEGSNVDLTQQMTHLMTSQRAFQMSSKVVQTADQIAELANQLR
jgi:flagellar basal-body rod protein FlgG